MFLKTFRWPFITTILALIAAFLYGGTSALVICIFLGILEISLSFDNAVVNARILEKMSLFWQKIFLTIGIIIAVFGMRIVFPFLIVAITANLGPLEAINLALEKGDAEQPGTYAYILHTAHPQIAAFGGMFLLLLFFNFFLEKREITWISFIEKPFRKIHNFPGAAILFALTILLTIAETTTKNSETILVSGILGILVYLAINGLGNFFYEKNETALKNSKQKSSTLKATGKAAFFMFLYLEIIDASFSFDGVLGAFAITADPIIIMLGLGVIGAVYVRSITIHFVKNKTLKNYVYLEHGAHWAIGALAVILLISIGTEVNEIITGLTGLMFILASFFHSKKYNKTK